jgi:RNA polymerase sigma-70 factor (ECF subfamily)
MRQLCRETCNKFETYTFFKAGAMPDWQDVEQSAEPIQLIIDAQNGDSGAFGQLYELYAESIFRFIYAHVDDRLDAEDLTEEVFFRTWRKLSGFKHQGVPFVAFLFRVARNALVDHYRRTSRSRQQLSLEDDLVSDSQPDPGDLAAASMEREEIREILGELREDYKAVLLLRFMGGLTPEETAEVMGKSAGAVRVLQHRTLAALRKLLGHRLDNGDE